LQDRGVLAFTVSLLADLRFRVAVALRVLTRHSGRKFVYIR